MSVPDNDISKFNNGDDDVNDDDDDRHEDVGVSGVHHGGGSGRRKQKQQKLKNFRYGFRRNVAKAKKVVLSPINYLLPQSESNSESKSKSNKNPDLKNPSFSNQTGDDHRRIDGVVKNNSCFCFIMQNQNFKSSSSSSQSPDCNDSKFTFDMLKALVESNDFYAKECNPHLDSITPSS